MMIDDDDVCLARVIPRHFELLRLLLMCDSV